MKINIFEKNFTRDNCFILQEIWDDGLSRDYFGNQNPFFPPEINYLYDGAVELWGNKKGLQWFMDKLLEKNKKDSNFLPKIIRRHKNIAAKLNKTLKKEHLNSVEELREFLKLVKSGTRTFLAFYYSLVNKKTPKKIKELAYKLRAKDSFYDSADYLIKKTIEHLYPYTKGLAVSILDRELDLPPDRNILKKRFNHCIMIIDGTLEIIDLNNFLKRKLNYRFLFDKIIKTSILKGQVANPGLATGKARILRRKDQIKNLKLKEILISPMTTPDFVPAMKKAGAIVTDEGGITSHAAIVSRELKKPCVIGTKIATRVLKDGDLVEVDANRGVVKIIKNK